MRLKLDENLSPAIAGRFRAAGHDVHTVRSEGLAGAVDEVVYKAAVVERRLLITLDRDFSDPIRYPPAGTPGVIVLRPPRLLISLIERLVDDTIHLFARQSPAGSTWIVEPGRVRVYVPEPD